MKCNNEPGTTLESKIGISADRGKEMDAKILGHLKRLTEPGDDEEVKEWSPSDCFAACADIPQTIEEAYYVGLMVGGAVEGIKMRSKSGLAALMMML